MLGRTRVPIEYQSWLQTEPDAVSLHLAELIAEAKGNVAADQSRAVARVGLDWPTLLLAIGIYGAFATVTLFYRDLPWWLVLPLGAAIVCLQASLQHEAVHGYPTRWSWLNYMIAAPALSLWLPYGLYRAIHLKHHVDENLTDPKLDPESNYLTPEAWLAMSPIQRALREVMMSLLGRMVAGPFYAAARSLKQLVQALRSGDRCADVLGTAWHRPGWLDLVDRRRLRCPARCLSAAVRLARNGAGRDAQLRRASRGAGRGGAHRDHRGRSGDELPFPLQQSARSAS